MAHLGEELKVWRKAKNMDQLQMAKYLDIGHRTYQEIEGTGIVKKISDLNKIQSKTGLNTQINAQSGTLIEQAMMSLSNSYAVLVETHREVVSTNKDLVMILKAKLSLDETGKVSEPSQVKAEVKLDPVERTDAFVGKKAIVYDPKKKAERRDISD